MGVVGGRGGTGLSYLFLGSLTAVRRRDCSQDRQSVGCGGRSVRKRLREESRPEPVVGPHRTVTESCLRPGEGPGLSVRHTKLEVPTSYPSGDVEWPWPCEPGDRQAGVGRALKLGWGQSPGWAR